MVCGYGHGQIMYHVCAYMIILPHMPIFTNLLIGYIVKIECHERIAHKLQKQDKGLYVLW